MSKRPAGQGITRQRSYEWTSIDPSNPPLSDRSGLEFFQGLADGSLPAQPITQTIGWTVDTVEKGMLRLAFEPQEYLFHAGGLLHGGVIATLLDSAMSGAVLSTLNRGQGCTTLQISINNIRGVKLDTGRLYAQGKVTSAGRRTGVATSTLMDDEGRLYAQGTTSCLIFDVSK